MNQYGLAPDVEAEIHQAFTAVLGDEWVHWEPLRFSGPAGLEIACEAHDGRRLPVSISFPDQPGGPIFRDKLIVAADGSHSHRVVAHELRRFAVTTLGCALGFVEGGSRRAGHLAPTDTHGLPGWHLLMSPLLAVGPDEDAMADAFMQFPILRLLAPTIDAELTEPNFNTIQLSLQLARDRFHARVTINGSDSQDGSDVLGSLPWPPLTAVASAYALTIRRGAT